MKIAFLLFHWPVLSETFIMNQITGLLDRGHEVDTYAISPGREPVVHEDIEKYHLLERTFYYGSLAQKLPANKFIRVTKAIGLLIKHARNPLPLLRALNVFKFGRMASSLGIFYTVAPFMGADKYDVVHCHFGPNGNLAALLKDVGAIKGKIVVAFHGEAGYVVAGNVSKKRYRKGFAPLFERSDLILPMSEREKQNLIKLGCPPQKIVVHRMGVDLSKFTFVPRRPRGNGVVHLLTVARLVEKKGIEYAIKAVAKAAQKYPQIIYNVVGDGPLKHKLANLIESLPANGRIKLLGWKRQEEVAEFMKEADIFLAPSVTSSDGDQEGIPVALMEAMAQGLPVLSTWHSGIPELVQDGQSGFLVPERDVEALADRLEYLIEHPQLWAEMGKAGRDYVEKHYNINTLNDRLVRLYQRLLAGELQQPHYE